MYRLGITKGKGTVVVVMVRDTAREIVVESGVGEKEKTLGSEEVLSSWGKEVDP